MIQLDRPIAKGVTADVFRWQARQVLKLYRSGYTGEIVQSEVAKVRAVRAKGINTPAVIEAIAVGNRFGIIFEYVEGKTMLEVLSQNPQQSAILARELATLQAKLHSCTGSNLPLQRQHLHHRIWNAPGLSLTYKGFISAILADLADEQTLCHGDLHPKNVMMTPTGAVIIDWLDATQGHPLADVARTCLLLNHAVLPNNLEKSVKKKLQSVRYSFWLTYLRHYSDLRSINPALLTAWKLPMAAARLSEPLPPAEREELVNIVQILLANQ